GRRRACSSGRSVTPTTCSRCRPRAGYPMPSSPTWRPGYGWERPTRATRRTRARPRGRGRTCFAPAVGGGACGPSAGRQCRPDPPVVAFLLPRLEAPGLPPAGPATPRTLIRRPSLVLTGLPPTPEEVEAFLAECCPRDGATAGIPRAALERLVDRLLASPHFG